MILNVIDAVDKHLVHLAKNNNRDNSHFHPSSWDGCKRQHAYAYYEAKGYIKSDDSALKISPQLERIFGNGHGMHHRWRSYIESTNALFGIWECKNWMAHETPKMFGTDSKLGCLKPKQCECGSKRFRYHEIGVLDDESMWGGHIDAVVDQQLLSEYLGIKCKIKEDERIILIDFKTINAFEFKALEKPKSEHQTQMQIYLYLTGLTYGKFIYEDKNSQSVKEYLVIADPNVLSVKKSEAIALKKIVTITVNGKHKLPPRGFAARSNPNCQRCKYRGHCWSETHEQNKLQKQNDIINKPAKINIGDIDV